MDMDRRITGLDLFSGIGGISLALRPWVRTVAYCEIERYATAVLLSRQMDGTLDRAPVWDDVTTLNGRTLSKAGIRHVDIISGGFPCQDISVAGAGAGVGGLRSGLFREIIRLAGELRPTFIYLENVPAITTRGLGTVLGALAEIRYDCRWGCLSAYDVGAPHQRDRWWCLAYPNRGLGNGSKFELQTGRHPVDSRGEAVTDTDSIGRERSGASRRRGDGFEDSSPTSNPLRERSQRPETIGKLEWNGFSLEDWRLTEPPIRRANDGVPLRSHRIKGLGNAVVPQQAGEAFERLIGIVPT